MLARVTCASLVLAACLAVAVSALAATPKAGCWGTCGGDEGPVGGFFTVKGHRVIGGVSAEFRCLGVQDIDQPAGPPAVVGDLFEVPAPASRTAATTTSLKINRHGHFSFHGYGERIHGKHTSRIMVSLSGEFVSATEALLTFHIAYGSCATQRLTVRLAG